MRTLSSVTLSACSPLCLALLLTACGGKTDGASNAAGSAGTDSAAGSAGTATAGSGGSGTAGSGGSGVAGTGGGGTAGSAGSAGGGAAGSAGAPVTTPVVIGTAGENCSPAGQLACQGVDSKVQLICSGGAWQPLGTCAGAQICDPREGSATLGTCVDKDPACEGHSDGRAFCDGLAVSTCDSVGVSSVHSETCVDACWEGTCYTSDPCPAPEDGFLACNFTSECGGFDDFRCSQGAAGSSGCDELFASSFYTDTAALRIVVDGAGCTGLPLVVEWSGMDGFIMRLSDGGPVVFADQSRCQVVPPGKLGNAVLVPLVPAVFAVNVRLATGQSCD